ncbi:malto-oligosyltrehalose synthase [soil metagenome]
MYIPASTYRLQITKSFNFKNLKKILPYLNKLGISTIYAAPFFEARPGSTHGYDVTDPHILNPEIGTMHEFKMLAEELKEYNMGWLQDIVPNHMAFDPGNSLIMDVFEKGKRSNYYQYFDINWEHPDPAYQGKIMTPFLGSSLENALKKNELELEFFENSFFVKYYETRYPLSISSYLFILKQAKQAPAWINGSKSNAYNELLANFEELDLIEENELYEKYWLKLKMDFFDAVENKREILNLIQSAVRLINRNKKLFQDLLDLQHFRLTYWKNTEEEINYRRFFTVNDLICLNMQDEKIFQHYHQFIHFLHKQELIQALRIDHIDGLFDPTQYINRLRKYFGDEVYIVVEKILEWDESMPRDWPIQGTSGYHFLACVSHLFTDHTTKDPFTNIYNELVPGTSSYHDLVRDKKYFILMHRMKGELNNLMHLLENLYLLDYDNESISHGKLREALAYFLVFYPVYRIYGNSFPLNESDSSIIKNSLKKAEDHAPHLGNEINFFQNLFKTKESDDEEYDKNRLYFLMRCQQFAGPLAAKGVEDTAFYIYNRLISHNEVGDSPDIFGISTLDFHEKMLDRLKKNPLAINTTATHDTKRGEDARIRINVLSELPGEWKEKVIKWKDINKNFIDQFEGDRMPSNNDEYFIYQTLIGVFPMSGKPEDNIEERLKEYMIKVVREAKVNTSWADPNENYENSIKNFIASILSNEDFLQDFQPFLLKIVGYGVYYSLGQVLIKITAPGIPDIYQGCELWDLSMVDPDNRRPVDFDLRQKYLKKFEKTETDSKFLQNLLEEPEDGRIKMFTTIKALEVRRKLPDLFAEGDYLPLEISGKNSSHVFGYLRKLNSTWCLILLPGALVSLDYLEKVADMNSIWEDTFIHLPPNSPNSWTNVYTNNKVNTDGQLSANEVFSGFPVALLTGNKNNT